MLLRTLATSLQLSKCRFAAQKTAIALVEKEKKRFECLMVLCQTSTVFSILSLDRLSGEGKLSKGIS